MNHPDSPAASAHELSKEWWPTHFPRLWPLLNSSIGLWFLSSVLIGGLGSLYTCQQSRLSETLKRQEFLQAEMLKTTVRVEKLDLEIGYRLSTAVSQLEEMHRQPCPRTEKTAMLCKAVQQNLSALFTSRSAQPTMFPEFASYSTLALIAELARLVPVQDQETLRAMISTMSGFSSMLLVEHAPMEQPTLVAGAILKRLVLPRWQKGFYYLDCSTTTPFC